MGKLLRTSGPELFGGTDSLKINQNRPVPKPRSSWLMEKPPDIPKNMETMKPVPKTRWSLLKTDENIVVES